MKLFVVFLLSLVLLTASFFLFPEFWSSPAFEVEQTIPNNPQLIALDSIAEYYENEGWTSDAAYLIAGFEVDLYDESDTAEYRLYVAYMED